MSWENAQLIRICAPPLADRGNNWVEHILGSIVKPLLSEFGGAIRRVGMLRYDGEYEHENPEGIPKLPERYRDDDQYRFIWLRISTEDTIREAVNQQCVQLIEQAGCHSPAGWQDYDLVSDLGKDHFTRPDSNDGEKARRAHLIAEILDATTRLMLDCLVRDINGEWQFEINPGSDKDGRNPNNSTFEAAHHLFCNATGVPLDILLIQHREQQQVLAAITYWTKGLKQEDWNLIAKLPVQY